MYNHDDEAAAAATGGPLSAGRLHRLQRQIEKATSERWWERFAGWRVVGNAI